MKKIMGNNEYRDGILGKAFLPIRFSAIVRRVHRIVATGYVGELVNIVATSDGEVFLFSFPFRQLRGEHYQSIIPHWFTVEPRMEAGEISYLIRGIDDIMPMPIGDPAFSEPETPKHTALDRRGIDPSKNGDQVFTLVRKEGEYAEDAIKAGIRYDIATAGSVDDDDIDQFIVLNSKERCTLVGVPATITRPIWSLLMDDPEMFEFEIVKELGFLFPKITAKR